MQSVAVSKKDLTLVVQKLLIMLAVTWLRNCISSFLCTFCTAFPKRFARTKTERSILQPFILQMANNHLHTVSVTHGDHTIFAPICFAVNPPFNHFGFLK